MGGGDDGQPLVGPTTGDGSDSSEVDEDSRQTGIDEHTSDTESEKSKDTGKPPSGAPIGSGGAGAGGVVGGKPPATEEPTTEEPDGEAGEPESEQSGKDSEPPEEEPGEVDETEAEEDNTGDEDDDDDDEEQEARIVVRSDSWDNVGLGIYPIRYQLKEEYGDQVQIDDRLVPVREFDSSEEMAGRWEKYSRRHQMPVDTSVWNTDPPESTEFSNRAFAAACEQGRSLARSYLRRLRIAAIVEGRNIEDQEILFELAAEVGLETNQLEEDWNKVHVRTSTRDVETPKTTIDVDGETANLSGLLHIDDIKMILEQAGLKEQDPQPLPGFVDEYGPVALKEIQHVYGYEEEIAVEKLENSEAIIPVEYGDTRFWTLLE